MLATTQVLDDCTNLVTPTLMPVRHVEAASGEEPPYANL
jgi:hypothetical protein